MSSELYMLRWNNHQSNLVDVFDNLLQQEAFVDVTISCDGKSFPAHRLVLSACSNYFQELLMKLPCKHPVIFLKDVHSEEMENLLKFMYKGEVNIAQSGLEPLLQLAKSLQIKGLADVSQEKCSENEHPRSSTPNNMDEKPAPKRQKVSQNKTPYSEHNSVPNDGFLPVLNLSVNNRMSALDPYAFNRNSRLLSPMQASMLSPGGILSPAHHYPPSVPDLYPIKLTKSPETKENVVVKREVDERSTSDSLQQDQSLDSTDQSVDPHHDDNEAHPVIRSVAGPTPWLPMATEKPLVYQCELCGKAYPRNRKQRYLAHLLQHSGKRAYRCQECGRGFNRSDHLNVHMRMHSGDTPYSCPTCLARFSYVSALKWHRCAGYPVRINSQPITTPLAPLDMTNSDSRTTPPPDRDDSSSPSSTEKPLEPPNEPPPPIPEVAEDKKPVVM